MTNVLKNQVRRGFVTTGFKSVASDLSEFDPGDTTTEQNWDVTEFLAGDDNPQYKSQVKSHVNALCNLTASKSDVGWENGSYSYQVTNWQPNPGGDIDPIFQSSAMYRGHGQFVTPPVLSGSLDFDDSCLDTAKVKFVSNARQQMSAAQGGTILGELRETLHGIRHPADAIRRSLASYLSTVKKRGRGLRKASKQKKNSVVASTWLEFTFGWRPLLADIDNAMEALARLTTGIQPTSPVRGYGKVERDDGDYDGAVQAGALQILVHTKQKTTSQAWVYGAVDHTTDLNIPTFRGAFGLRAHDIVPTIWEILPYSFVVDYFTNLGDIISCATFNTSYLAWWGASVTCESRATSTGRSPAMNDFVTPPSTISGSIHGGSAYSYRKSIGRFHPGTLVPSVQFRIPGVKQGFNLGALVAQARSIRI